MATRGMSIRSLLDFADEPTLLLLVGATAVTLLRLLDPSLVSAKRLREMVLELHAPQELLRDDETRAALLNLLPSEKADELVTALKSARPEPLFAMLRQRGAVRRGSVIEKSLFSFFGVVPEPEHEASSFAACERVIPSYVLFEHQRRAAFQVLNKLSQPPRRVVLHMPTGAGKTRTAMAVIAEHLRSTEGTVVVWLAYSSELCEQAAAEFTSAWTSLGNREVSVYRFWGDSDIISAKVGDGLLVAGLAKLRSASAKDIEYFLRLADCTSLIVVDEAHQSIAPTYRSILDTMFHKRPDTGLLGLTATPGRTWSDISEDEKLADFFAHQKVTLSVNGYPNPVEYLISHGYLARPMFVRFASDSTVRLTSQELEELALSLDVPTQVLQRLAADEQRNLQIVQKTEELLERHTRVILFAATVEHAFLLATTLRARGHEADAIAGTTPMLVRQRVVQKFRNNSTHRMVICNFGVLTAGFDAPRTSAALIARPTKSLVLYSQMIGRATRGPLVGGNSTSEIVTVTDPALPGFGDMSEAFRNWEDVW